MENVDFLNDVMKLIAHKNFIQVFKNVINTYHIPY